MFQKVPIGKHYYNWLLSSQFTGLGSRYYTSSIHFLVVCMLATIVLYSNTCCCCMCTITYFLGGRIKIWIEEWGKHHCSYFIHIPLSLLQFFVVEKYIFRCVGISPNHHDVVYSYNTTTLPYHSMAHIQHKTRF